ncbi:MAG TPA: twin-arginine translocation signal domain-containing protein [Gemmatimonadaceae bacterium]|nr:twin-arginine translocation signal domain-containing protein [Gemmatimonadaceae bacterium]
MTSPHDPTHLSRRAFLQATSVGAVGALASACSVAGAKDTVTPPVGPRITARPGAPTGTITPGEQALSLGGDGRDGLLYVPASYSASKPAPLVLMLHGATGSARGALRPFRELADDAGLVLLAPESRGTTWDAIRGTYDVDVAFINRALTSVFQRVAIDPARLTIEGFSDGATYAIGVGISNGDLFQRIVAFSPGFILPVEPHAKPRVFISHGTRDQILPIDQCSRRIVPELQRAKYDVSYQEFDGPHAVPPEMAKAAIAWMAGA